MYPHLTVTQKDILCKEVLDNIKLCYIQYYNWLLFMKLPFL